MAAFKLRCCTSSYSTYRTASNDCMRRKHFSVYTSNFGSYTINIHDTVLKAINPSCANSLLTAYDTVNAPAGIGAFSFNPGTLTWDLPVNIVAPITFGISVKLDCGLISNAADTVTNINFIMHFTSNNTDSVIVNGSNGIFSIANVFLPYFISQSASQYTHAFLDTNTRYYFYKNTGNTTGNVLFSFNLHQPCNADSVVSMDYATGLTSDTLSATYQSLASGWNAVTVPVNSWLIIRLRSYINGCTNACSNEKAVFKWRCNYDTLQNHCAACQQDSIVHTYALLSPPASIMIRRVSPVLTENPTGYFWDLSCMNTL